MPNGLTSNDECIAFAPQLALCKALTSFWILGIEEIVEEVPSTGVEDVAVGAFTDLFPAER